MKKKSCPICESEKPLSAFGRNRQSVDGLHYYCKACAAARQRAWAKANQEKVKSMRIVYLERIRATNAQRDPYA